MTAGTPRPQPADDTGRADLERPTGVARRVGLAVLLVLVPVYAATAHWTLPYHIDALTNALTGYAIADAGTPVLRGYEELTDEEQIGNLAWVRDGVDGPVSQYPPGAALTVAPFHLLAGADAPPTTMVGSNRPDAEPVTIPVPPMWPATLSAVLVTAAAMAAVAATLAHVGLSRRDAVVVGVTSGLATSAWSVASAQSWTHGPGMLAIALAGLAAARDRWLACGLLLGAGVLVRPHIALVAAAIGVGVSIARREVRPLLSVGAGSSVGLVALLAYNAAVFGDVSVSGGYAGGIGDRALSTSVDVAWLVGNVAAGLLDPVYGLLVWAPFLVPLAVQLVRDRRDLPDWTLASALGGGLYLLLQWRANRASGGSGFFPYRYPLEMLVASAPLLGLLAVRYWETRSRRARLLLVLTLVFALFGQVLGVLNT